VFTNLGLKQDWEVRYQYKVTWFGIMFIWGTVLRCAGT